MKFPFKTLLFVILTLGTLTFGILGPMPVQAAGTGADIFNEVHLGTAFATGSETFVPTKGVGLLKNGGFNFYPTGKRIPTNWTATNFGPGDGKDTTVKKEGAAAVKIVGAGKIKMLTQTLAASGPEGDALTLSFSMKTDSLSVSGRCRAQVILYDGIGPRGINDIYCPLGATHDWARVRMNITAPSAYTHVAVRLIFSKTSGTIWFDAVSLTR